jgi:hypothetical protein
VTEDVSKVGTAAVPEHGRRSVTKRVAGLTYRCDPAIWAKGAVFQARRVPNRLAWSYVGEPYLSVLTDVLLPRVER